MNRMRVKCIKCGKEWRKDSKISWGPQDISSSLCDACFKEAISPIIHKKQLEEGNFDCFGKAAGYCDQSGCKYRQWCFRMEEVTRSEQIHGHGKDAAVRAEARH